MTTTKKIARRKLSLLQLAQELDNVSKACRIMGYSRQQFYEIRRNYQTYGADGLVDRLPGARGPHPNRVSEEVEAAILDHCLHQPTQGCLRVAQELSLKGVQVSSGGVRGVWSRHNLLSKHERLLRLEQHTQERRVELTDQQIRLLERFSPEFRDRHIETTYTGELLGVDTFHVGTLKGVGRVYMQAAIDCRSRYAWAHLYTNKLPVTAVHLLNDAVLPTFDKHHATVNAVISELIEKLAALVPPPRLNLVRYHGVLAPHAADRSRIVPGPATRADEAEDGSGHARPASGRHRLSWAKLLARVFRIDVSVCPDCGGRMRVIAALTEPGSIRRCLAGMGLSRPTPPEVDRSPVSQHLQP